jgi:probable O-glycosylation ligase (exosortase A-associated)
MILLSNQKSLLIPVALLASLFAAFLVPQKLRDRLSEITDVKEASAASRINAWTYCWNVANDYPLAGGGFEAFTPALFARYAPNPNDVHGPHSIYFGVLLEHGFVGVFLYFLLVGYCFVVLRRIVKLARFYDDEQSAHYARMLGFSLIGFLTAGAFLGRTYFDFYFMIVACVAILRQVTRKQWASSADLEEDLVCTEEHHTLLPSPAGV